MCEVRKADVQRMTEEEAKVVIRTPGYPNVAEVLEAFEVAYEVLGKDASLTDIYRWADNRQFRDSLFFGAKE